MEKESTVISVNNNFNCEVVNTREELINSLLKITNLVEKLEELCTVPELKVRYHKELYPELLPIKVSEKGNFIDLRAAEEVHLNKGDFALISLGVSIELPNEYWAQFVPRSSSFKNFGIIQTNSFAVIDTSYCGDNDIWRMPVYATRDTDIHVNDRICQFRIVKDNPFTIKEVEKLENEDRDGFGSTGVK